jgi:hypothetical protein
MTNTSFYMGPIHPRIKKPVGERLATAAMGVAYGGAGAYAGPTLSGCTAAAGSITVRFNSSLLRGGAVGVKRYDGRTSFSAMRVLVDGAFWCKNTTLAPVIDGRASSAMCADAGAPNWGQCGKDVQCFVGGAAEAMPAAVASGEGTPTQVWVLVDVKARSGTEVTLDLAKLQGADSPGR